MVDTADILRKAADDVTQGMWCKGAMFQREGEPVGETMLPGVELTTMLDEALKMRRCAIGSIAVATQLLGGNTRDYEAACRRVANSIDVETVEPLPWDVLAPETVVAYFNDKHLPDDRFMAGQEMAELLRKAADSL